MDLPARTEHRTVESAQAGVRAEHDMAEKTVENAGLFGVFMIQWEHENESCRDKKRRNRNDSVRGI